MNRLFQHKFVYVSSIGFVIITKVISLQMMFIIEKNDLNAHTFNKDTRYHILPDFDVDGGFLKRLPSEICGSIYHDVDIVCDSLSRDLEEAVAFQNNFIEVVIEALEVRFVDNNLMDSFKILSPTNMLAKQVGLKSWGVTRL